MQVLNCNAKDFEASFTEILNNRRAHHEEIGPAVREILARLRTEGDHALLELTQKFDQHQLPLRLRKEEIEAAKANASTSLTHALQTAIHRVRDYHMKQIPQNMAWEDTLGVKLGWKWDALQSVGLYVPGGSAGYPSSLVMNVVPAQIAGVKRIAIVSPTPKGRDQSSVLTAASLLGIDEIYRIGGAQAIGALAYGTKTIAPVCKIFGPGNAWVSEAKRSLFGQVGIDSIAGPSEVTILADNAQDARLIAADMLAQAEHGPDSQALLLTTCKTLAHTVVQEIDRQSKVLSRASIAQQSIRQHGAIILLPPDQDTHKTACELVARIAPEHLQICLHDTQKSRELAQNMLHVGSIFIRSSTPEVLADYLAGPNHVLPTFGSARFASGLGVPDFMRRTSLLECPPSSLQHLKEAIILAEAEGLTAHANAIRLRLAQSS